MTLFPAPHATKVLALAVVLAASGMTAAKAGDGRFERGWSGTDVDGRMITRRNRHARDDWRPRDRRKHGDPRAERHDRWRKDGDFYGGALTAYRDAGNGIYFYLDGDAEGFYRPLVENRGPSVIHVVPGQSGCSWEAGVCVVRP